MAKPRTTKSKLTEKQADYVEARLDGKSKTQAAKLAGYALSATQNALVEKAPSVSEALARARSELASTTQIKRVEVIEMLKEAYDMAKLVSEPGNMVAAAREIGKMLGFYEPETIKVQMTLQQSNMKQKFEALSDEELLQIAEGQARVIDGEFHVVS